MAPMNATHRVQVVLELLEGKSSAAELAQREGVTGCRFVFRD